MRKGFWTRVRIFSDEMRLESSIMRHKLSDPKVLRALLKLVLVILAIILISQVASYFFANPDKLFSLIASAKGFAPFIIIGLIIIEVVVAPLPGFIIMVVAGYLFGPVLGAIYSYLGNVIGSMIAFFLAQKFGRPFVEKIVSHRLITRYDRFFAKTRKYLMFLYMLPIVPVDILSFIAGFSSMSWKRFLVIVIVGFIPNTLILASFGDFLEGLNLVVSVFYFLIFLVIFGLLVWLFKWIVGRLNRRS